MAQSPHATHAHPTRTTTWLRRDGVPMFFLGDHNPRDLETSPVPLLVSRRRLFRYAGWTVDEDTFGGQVYRLLEQVGPMWLAAPQDWMCEPWITAKTGLSVAEHQDRTVENFLYLRDQFPHAPWMPVLQGWTLEDYLRCAQLYEDNGVDLASERTVGLGSVCRRQATSEIEVIAATLARRGYRLHGFGVKPDGLRRYARHLYSADSLAWSYAARVEDTRLPGCTHRGPCSNCLTYALAWRERVMAAMDEPTQDSLDLPFGLVR